MQKKYLLGFDVGTSESKGTLTDLEGHVLAIASAKHGIISPYPGFAEHDPIADWMSDLKKVIQRIIEADKRATRGNSCDRNKYHYGSGDFCG